MIFIFRNDSPSLPSSTTFRRSGSWFDLKPLSWLHLTHPQWSYDSFHGIEPEVRGAIGGLPHAVAFSKGLMMEGENGCIGIFQSGNPVYNDKTFKLSPDQSLGQLARSWHHKPLKAAMVFGGPGADVRKMEEEAALAQEDILEIQYLGTSEEAGGQTLETYQVEKGELSFTISRERDGVYISEIGGRSSLKVPQAGAEVRRNSDLKIFNLTTCEGWETVRVVQREDSVTIYTANPQAAQIANFALLTEGIFTRDHRIEWRTSVLNDNEDITVMSADYPSAYFAGERLNAFIPQSSGWVAEDIAQPGSCLLEGLCRIHYVVRTSMVSLRYRYTPLFYRGEMLRPARVESDQSDHAALGGLWFTTTASLPAVMSGTWKQRGGTKSVMFVINCSDEEAQFTAVANAGEYGIQATEQLHMFPGNNNVEAAVESGRFTIKGTLAPQDYIVVEWQPIS